MFTGIIETLGRIHEIQKDQNNLHITVDSLITNELKIDQSISHNGICLTVVAIKDSLYTVTAIGETILKTTIGDWKLDDIVNLERGVRIGDRLDGHIVQGHVDQTGTCSKIEKRNGSWEYTFEYDKNLSNITIEKGSITVNGVSLTVVNSETSLFSVSIIPYTFENTNFRNFKIGTKINLEFDIVGKYISRLYSINKI